MTALLVSEGLTRPSFAPPQVVVSNSSTPGAADAPDTTAGGATEAFLPTADGTGGEGGTNGNVTNNIKASSAQYSDTVMVKGLEMIHALADPNGTPQRAALDLATACFMWADVTPMRWPHGNSPALDRMCGEIAAGAPRAVASFLAPPTGPTPLPGLGSLP